MSTWSWHCNIGQIQKQFHHSHARTHTCGNELIVLKMLRYRWPMNNSACFLFRFSKLFKKPEMVVCVLVVCVLHCFHFWFLSSKEMFAHMYIYVLLITMESATRATYVERHSVVRCTAQRTKSPPTLNWTRAANTTKCKQGKNALLHASWNKQVTEYLPDFEFPWFSHSL